MLDKIKPGSEVNVKVVKQPTNGAAAKTLVRVLSKSASVRPELNRLDKVRAKQYAPSRRGGRLYGGHMKKIHPIKGQLGEEANVTATVDVINDLKSVTRFIEVTPA